MYTRRDSKSAHEYKTYSEVYDVLIGSGKIQGRPLLTLLEMPEVRYKRSSGVVRIVALFLADSKMDQAREC